MGCVVYARVSNFNVAFRRGSCVWRAAVGMRFRFFGGGSQIVPGLAWLECVHCVFWILYLGGAGCFAGRIMSPNFQSRGEGLAHVFRATSWLVRAP